MKRITAITILLAGFAAVGASAQENGVQANIPFDFTVASKLLPSGTYRLVSIDPNVVEIRNVNKNKFHAIGIVNADGEKTKTNKLVFHKYGDQYFLSEILCTSGQMNLAFSVSKLEKDAQRQEASLRAATQTVVALK